MKVFVSKTFSIHLARKCFDFSFHAFKAVTVYFLPRLKKMGVERNHAECTAGHA